MQKYAITAGRETKCPSCGCLDNDGNYQDYLRNRGIYCPDKKPDWEADGAYDDVERYTYKYVAETCRCPHGIHYEEDRGKWEVLCCYFCGDNCIHIECRSSSKNDKIFVCDVCSNTVKEKLEFTESDMLPLRND
ncbi:G2/M phase-specific E3 ubiquitin-protein ligase-like [Contarinia nasturtii]|uniref:G2/M phase-specific E3 ubiquitin-protein ligase-like n=1 Tax=Contarinia nasturtii TaxID=265458 RepID=UPI0012D40AE3|nr:G2/M phase-specific E3 ubiquitin-protein ligase-like [Contarinia nasturtii]